MPGGDEGGGGGAGAPDGGQGPPWWAHPHPTAEPEAGAGPPGGLQEASRLSTRRTLVSCLCSYIFLFVSFFFNT